MKHINDLIILRQSGVLHGIAMYFKLYKDAGGYWRWTLYSANNRKIADSGESYHNKSDAEDGINLVKSTNSTTPVKE